MMPNGDSTSAGPPLLPPPWFMKNLNETRDREGLPALTCLDPVSMMCWHLVSQSIVRPVYVPLSCI